jgi:hypothetical protein
MCKSQFLQYKKRPRDLQNLATSRFKICMRNAVVRRALLVCGSATRIPFAHETNKIFDVFADLGFGRNYRLQR